MPRRSRTRRGGFTLLELLWALFLIAFVSGICIPAYFEAPSVTLENAATLLARDLRSAQNRAAYLGEPIEIAFEPGRHAYRVTRSGGAPDPERLAYSRRYTRDAVFQGVRLVSAEFGGDATLVYDSAGRATESGTVTLAFGGEVRTLLVAAPTGELSLPDSSAGWVDRGFTRTEQ